MNLKHKISKKIFVLAMDNCINSARIMNDIDNFKQAVNDKNNNNYLFKLPQTSLEIEDDFYGITPFDLKELYPDYDEDDSDGTDSVFECGSEEYKKIHEQIKNYLINEEDVVNTSITDGNIVGQLAREYFDLLLEKENIANNTKFRSVNTSAYTNTKDIIRITNDALNDKQCKYIYEAGFQACKGNLITKCDILEIVDHENKIVKIHEVKASTDGKVKWTQTYDLFYQIIVLNECGFIVEDVSLVLLNREYSNSLLYFKTSKEQLEENPRIIFEDALNVVNQISHDNDDDYNEFFKDEDIRLERLFSICDTKNYYKIDYKIMELYEMFYNSFADLGEKGLERFLNDLGESLTYDCGYSDYCRKLEFNKKSNIFLMSEKICGHVIPIAKINLDYPTVLDIPVLNGSKKADIIKDKDKNPYLSKGILTRSFEDNKKATNEIGAIIYDFWREMLNEGFSKKTEQDLMPQWLFANNKKMSQIGELIETYNCDKNKVYMYDFETIKYAVPKFQFLSPYTQVPFQYSIHILKDEKYDYNNESTMIHKFWIAKDNKDPRVGFVKNFLRDMFSEGPGIYVAYNKSFEKTVIRNLIDAFPAFKKPLLYIYQNTHDLMDFFKKAHENCYIYQPKFNGSYSIKKTQPSLDPTISYKELKINNGLMASEIFRNFLDEKISNKMWVDNVREDMIKYCNRDTLAMVVVLKRVKEIYEEAYSKDAMWGGIIMPKKIKIIFAGTIDISRKILSTLCSMDYIEVVGVICQPDREVGRKKTVNECEVKKFAMLNNLKIFQPEKINDIYDEIKELDARFLITCAFGQFVSQRILDLFDDCYNIHGSLLPKYRGGSPLQKAIANGDKTTGVSIMRMVKKMDAGPVFAKIEFNIEDEDDAESIFEKAGIEGSKLLRRNLRDMLLGQIEPIEQDESQVTFAYNLKNEEEHVTFDKTAFEVHNFIRSLSPKPIAFAFINETRVKIKKTEVLNETNYKGSFEPGQIVDVDKKGIIVACNKNTFIRILEIQREGKSMGEASQYHKNRSIFENNEIFK